MIETKYTDNMFVQAVQKLNKSTAAEISEKVGCNSRYATVRLNRIVEAGKINSKKVSGRWVYWV